MKRVLINSRGFTIMEVLISATVFMIGFTTLIALLSSTLSKFSTKELIVARNLACEYMNQATIELDITPIDTVITRSEMSFHVKQTINRDDNLVKLQITVTREKSEKVIVDLYNEIAQSDK